eukprot:scpid47716/ scgid0470/ D-glucuronyl C5-epimerase; Heparin/heparan sulfate:glucuronic acid C5-epimerase
MTLRYSGHGYCGIASTGLDRAGRGTLRFSCTARYQVLLSAIDTRPSIVPFSLSAYPCVYLVACHCPAAQEFLDAAAKAIEPFKHLSKDGGVRAVFMDQYVWYEEYPTSPALFVLNGFISSMLGLYDLAEVMKDARGEQAAVAARRLFDAGFKSLHALLPLYDTGSGSIYDLRHFMTRQAPNVVRAEYHVTHLNQLATLSSIFPDDEQLKTFYQRWLGYHNGHRVPRN